MPRRPWQATQGGSDSRPVADAAASGNRSTTIATAGMRPRCFRSAQPGSSCAPRQHQTAPGRERQKTPGSGPTGPRGGQGDYEVNINSILPTGNLGRDPKLRYTPALFIGGLRQPEPARKAGMAIIAEGADAWS